MTAKTFALVLVTAIAAQASLIKFGISPRAHCLTILEVGSKEPKPAGRKCDQQRQAVLMCRQCRMLLSNLSMLSRVACMRSSTFCAAFSFPSMAASSASSSRLKDLCT